VFSSPLHSDADVSDEISEPADGDASPIRQNGFRFARHLLPDVIDIEKARHGSTWRAPPHAPDVSQSSKFELMIVRLMLLSTRQNAPPGSEYDLHPRYVESLTVIVRLMTILEWHARRGGARRGRLARERQKKDANGSIIEK
jgi:hypothetical protein